MNVISTNAFGRGDDRGGSGGGVQPERVAFHRTELSVILNTYGRMVAAGEWRDYGIDFLPDRAVFSVFRRATEHPLYRIEKDPRRAQRQGAYSVVAQDGRVLKRGADLTQVMRVFDAKLRLID
ncbi:MAG: DUF2794 domain-containing protein [Paracoccaceae bacterium]